MVETGHMTKKSPAVARVVAVLSFFLEHPQQSFTLTQVVKSLRLSRATTHTILLGLVDAGFLYRRPDKSYLVGPVLHSLAAGAQRHFSPLSIANIEMRTLADELDVVASAIFAESDEVVVRERAASVKHLGWGNLAPSHLPLLPAGSVFVMLLSDAEIAARIDKVKPPLGEKDRGDVLAQVEFGRRHGFIAGFSSDERKIGPELEGLTRFLPDFEDREHYTARFLIAPVVGTMGEVVMAMSLQGLPPKLTRDQVIEYGRHLREACQRVSNFIGGTRRDQIG